MVLPVQLAGRGALRRRAGALVVVAFEYSDSILPTVVDLANRVGDDIAVLYFGSLPLIFGSLYLAS
jgi:hypothetical protein